MGMVIGRGFEKKSLLTSNYGALYYWAAFYFCAAEYFKAVGAPLYPEDLICLWNVTGMLVFYSFVGS